MMKLFLNMNNDTNAMEMILFKFKIVLRYGNPVLVITILLLASVSLFLTSTSSFGNLFPFVNGQELGDTNTGNIKQAISSQVIEKNDGTKLDLELTKVVKNINGSSVIMYGLNGQVPGPIIKVKQDSSIFVNLTNNIDMDSSIHWHGLKLNNKYDGVPALTQDPIKPGNSFLYELDFPNEGVYWYHSHLREDKQQDLGIYGVILVEPKSKDYYNPVDVEVPLTLDDILMANGNVYPYNKDHETFALMGRYGNVMLLNGQTNYQLNMNADQTVRFYLVDTANTRPYNFTIEGHGLKLVGGDSGKYEKESLVNSAILSPGERQIVEVLFDKPGDFKILNVTPEKVYQLGIIRVSEQKSSSPPIGASSSSSFYTLHSNADIITQMAPYNKYQVEKPDYVIDLTVNLSQSMADMTQMMGSTRGEESNEAKNSSNIEWDVPEEKARMNENSTPDTVKWILKNNATGNENETLAMKTGEIKKIKFYNDPNSAHPMQHPIHIHGLRFLVLSQDGKANNNLVWKDVVLVPTGSSVDILLVADNPGLWQMHCHISEHLGAGMESVIKVT